MCPQAEKFPCTMEDASLILFIYLFGQPLSFDTVSLLIENDGNELHCHYLSNSRQFYLLTVLELNTNPSQLQ